MEDKLKVKIIVSTKKDSYEAGREITEKILQQFNEKPNFILLYATGHYQINNGFEALLKGVWEKLPDETKLIGGAVNGFITNQGCFAQGVVAFVVKYDKMNVIMSCGKNTKRNPKKAANQFVKEIKENTKDAYPNKILITNISSLEVPTSSDKSTDPVIKSKITAKMVIFMLKFLQKTKQKGFGREDEVLEEISKKLPDFNIIHGSSASIMTPAVNQQIYYKKALTESVVGLSIETDLNINLDYANAAEETDIKFNITKISRDKLIIKKINNKAALPEFLRLMGWTKEDFEKAKWIEVASKYPLGYYKNDKISIRTIMMIMGNYLGCLAKVQNNDVFVLKMTKEKMVNSVDKLLKPEKPEFALFNSCVARQGLLGVKTFDVHKKLKDYFDEKPFLITYAAGEGLKKSNQPLIYQNESIMSAIFEKNN